jgi:hypothetical protein
VSERIGDLSERRPAPPAEDSKSLTLGELDQRLGEAQARSRWRAAPRPEQSGRRCAAGTRSRQRPSAAPKSLPRTRRPPIAVTVQSTAHRSDFAARAAAHGLDHLHVAQRRLIHFRQTRGEEMAARQSGTRPRPSTSTVPETKESSAPTADTTL